MTKHLLYACIALATLCACGGKKAEENNSQAQSLVGAAGVPDPILTRFVFVGCNRLDRGDTTAAIAAGYSDASMANLPALNRIYSEVSALTPPPDYFFFNGDMILGESSLHEMNRELTQWVKDFDNSPVKTANIPLIPIGGNHEFLTWTGVKINKHTEWPLKGAIDVWMNLMGSYLPANRVKVPGTDAQINQATFSFTKGNVAFVVMNTDTYNETDSAGHKGWEGMIPMQWVVNQCSTYNADPSIDFIFVLGHKPCWVSNKLITSHDGLPEGPQLWPQLQKMKKCIAMLSAHVHDYQRMLPNNQLPWQIIAGNGGSSDPSFFGYSMINVYQSGRVELVSSGFQTPPVYYDPTTCQSAIVDQVDLNVVTKPPGFFSAPACK
jgi:Calcineurin-like phosphoesterase